MEQETTNILVGIREISGYMRRGPKVVRRLIRAGLPVSFEEGAYMTTKQTIDFWLSKKANKKVKDTKRPRTDLERT